VPPGGYLKRWEKGEFKKPVARISTPSRSEAGVKEVVCEGRLCKGKGRHVIPLAEVVSRCYLGEKTWGLALRARKRGGGTGQSWTLSLTQGMNLLRIDQKGELRVGGPKEV